jgi:hypothetical protein
MKLSPFRVSFDGPLARREQWRTRIVAVTLGAALLFGGAMAMTTLMNASSGVLGAWTNAIPAEGSMTTGVASPVEPSAREPRKTPPAVSGTAEVNPAVTPNQLPREIGQAKAQTQVKAKPKRRAQPQTQRLEPARSRAQSDAETERLWNERAARLGRAPLRGDARPFR